MLYFALVLNLVIYWVGFVEIKAIDSIEEGNLATNLRNDANIDLSADEEYEDLRAEFLAYHTALASLAPSARRSMKSTPCWTLGGICINYKLCEPHKSLSEIPGCKDNLNVCCFAWNKFYVRDQSEHGLHAIAMPWSFHEKVGGAGIVEVEPEVKKRKKKSKLKNKQDTPTPIVRVITL